MVNPPATTNLTPTNLTFFESKGKDWGLYFGQKADEILKQIPGVGTVMNYVNERYQTVDSREAYLIGRIRELQSALENVFRQLGISTFEEVQAKLQEAAPGERLDICEKAIEECFRFLNATKEMTSPLSEDASDSVIPVPNASTSQSTENALALEQPVQNESVSSEHIHPVIQTVFPEVFEEDPKIQQRIEELRILLEALTAVCFNDFTHLGEKHWNKIGAILESQSEGAEIVTENKGAEIVTENKGAEIVTENNKSSVAGPAQVV